MKKNIRQQLVCLDDAFQLMKCELSLKSPKTRNSLKQTSTSMLAYADLLQQKREQETEYMPSRNLVIRISQELIIHKTKKAALVRLLKDKGVWLSLRDMKYLNDGSCRYEITIKPRWNYSIVELVPHSSKSTPFGKATGMQVYKGLIRVQAKYSACKSFLCDGRFRKQSLAMVVR